MRGKERRLIIYNAHTSPPSVDYCLRLLSTLCGSPLNPKGRWDGQTGDKSQKIFLWGRDSSAQIATEGPPQTVPKILLPCSVQGCSKFSPSSDPLSTKRYLQARSDQQRSITSLKTGDLSPPFPPRPPNKWATTNGRRRLAQSFFLLRKKNQIFFLLLAC